MTIPIAMPRIALLIPVRVVSLSSSKTESKPEADKSTTMIIKLKMEGKITFNIPMSSLPQKQTTKPAKK